MEDSNTALLEAKNTSHKTHDQEILSSSHSHHMYEKFIKCFPKKKRRSWEFLSPILQTEFFLPPPPQKKLKVQTDSKIKYDGSKYQYTSLIKYWVRDHSWNVELS